jgi:hypothetical protein
MFKEALLPGIDRSVGARELAPDRAKGMALSKKENHLSPARFGHWDASATQPALKLIFLRLSQSNGGACHAATLNALYYISQ